MNDRKEDLQHHLRVLPYSAGTTPKKMKCLLAESIKHLCGKCLVFHAEHRKLHISFFLSLMCVCVSPLWLNELELESVYRDARVLSSTNVHTLWQKERVDKLTLNMLIAVPWE